MIIWKAYYGGDNQIFISFIPDCYNSHIKCYNMYILPVFSMVYLPSFLFNPAIMMITKSNFKIIIFRIQPLIALLVIFGISCQKKEPSQKAAFEKSGEPSPLSTQDLATIIPVTREKLKNWLPSQIGEYRINKTVIGYKESVEMSAIKGTYRHLTNPAKQVIMEILDGAGPVASVLLSGSIQKLNLDFEELNDDGYSRIYKRNGQRVWEVENKKEEISELEFIHNGRFLISLKGHHLQNEELWSFADYLDFKTLK